VYLGSHAVEHSMSVTEDHRVGPDARATEAFIKELDRNACPRLHLDPPATTGWPSRANKGS
jgi:hypothetical protein